MVCVDAAAAIAIKHRKLHSDGVKVGVKAYQRTSVNYSNDDMINNDELNRSFVVYCFHFEFQILVITAC